MLLGLVMSSMTGRRVQQWRMLLLRLVVTSVVLGRQQWCRRLVVLSVVLECRDGV